MARIQTVSQPGISKVRIELWFFWSTFTPTRGMPAEIREMFEDMIKRHLDMMGRVTNSWKSEHQPKWEHDIKASRDIWGAKWYTKSDVMRWLAEGTKERWAVMPRGFKRKTHVRKFGTFGPGGEPQIRGRKLMRKPRRGIQARLWHFEIARLEQRPRAGMKPRIEKAINAWVLREYGTTRGRKVSRHDFRTTI